jgi:hypothetical protein
MSGLTEEDLRRSRIHGLVRQTPAHMPLTELINAARRCGWCTGKGLDDREASAEVDRRRDILGAVIADMWERMRTAEARLAELSQASKS